MRVYRDFIDIYSKSSGKTERSAPSQELQLAFAAIHARVRPINSREIIEKNGINSEVEKEVRVQWQAHLEQITSAHVIRFKGIDYQIIGQPINPSEANQELVFLVKKYRV